MSDEAFRDDALEFALIGAVIATPSFLPLIDPRVVIDDFGHTAHWHAWSALTELHRSNKPITLATLRSELKRAGQINAVDGAVNLAALPHMAATLEQAEEYARRVNENGVARRTLVAAQRIALSAPAQQSPTEFTATAATLMRDAATTSDAMPHVPLSAIAADYDNALEEAERRERRIEGVTTGLFDLDQMTAGMRPGQLIIIAARPGMGKSALATAIATNAAMLDDARVAVFSLEMTRAEWWERMLCDAASVDSQRVRRREHDQAERNRMTHAAGERSHLPIEIYDRGGLTFAQIRAACLRIKNARGLGVVAIDYLTLINTNVPELRGESHEVKVGKVSQWSKELAKELSAPVVMLAQLNRKCEERPNKRPLLSDLRDSGEIEQNADAVWFVYRDEMYDRGSPWKGIAEIAVAKQRGGETGIVRVAYERTYTRFRALTDDEKAHCDALDNPTQTSAPGRRRRRQATPYQARTQRNAEETDHAAE